MKTYPIIDKTDGRTYAFEIENAYVQVGTIVSLLRKVEDISDVQPKKLFSQSDDIRVEFKYLNSDCVVVEPFGDSSRYWIGLRNSGAHATDIHEVENAFKQYRPSFIREVLGDLLSFRVFSRLLNKGVRSQ